MSFSWARFFVFHVCMEGYGSSRRTRTCGAVESPDFPQKQTTRQSVAGSREYVLLTLEGKSHIKRPFREIDKPQVAFAIAVKIGDDQF